MNNSLDEAITILRQGGIVIFPTDTAFGIGCRVDREDSIKRVFEIRNRPFEKAVPILVSSIEMAEKYSVHIDKPVLKIMQEYWPGGLTVVVLSRKDLIPPIARGSGTSVGLRIPNHETPLALIKNIGVPIIGPSANFSGDPTPYSFKELNKELIKKVDYVLDGECTVKKASTVVDCTQIPYKILREGAVTLSI